MFHMARPFVQVLPAHLPSFICSRSLTAFSQDSHTWYALRRFRLSPPNSPHQIVQSVVLSQWPQLSLPCLPNHYSGCRCVGHLEEEGLVSVHPSLDPAFVSLCLSLPEKRDSPGAGIQSIVSLCLPTASVSSKVLISRATCAF